MYNLMLFMHATSVSTYDSVSDLVFFLYNAALEINSTALNCFAHAEKVTPCPGQVIFSAMFKEDIKTECRIGIFVLSFQTLHHSILLL